MLLDDLGFGSSLVASFQGSANRATYGVLNILAITRTADPVTKDFVNFLMTDGYEVLFVGVGSALHLVCPRKRARRMSLFT